MKFTREQCLKWAEEAGFHHFYYRGDQQYHTALIEALCTLVWNAAIEEAAALCARYDNGRHSNYADICAEEIRKFKVTK